MNRTCSMTKEAPGGTDLHRYDMQREDIGTTGERGSRLHQDREEGTDDEERTLFARQQK